MFSLLTLCSALILAYSLNFTTEQDEAPTSLSPFESEDCHLESRHVCPILDFSEIPQEAEFELYPRAFTNPRGYMDMMEREVLDRPLDYDGNDDFFYRDHIDPNITRHGKRPHYPYQLRRRQKLGSLCDTGQKKGDCNVWGTVVEVDPKYPDFLYNTFPNATPTYVDTLYDTWNLEETDSKAFFIKFSPVLFSFWGNPLKFVETIVSYAEAHGRLVRLNMEGGIPLCGDGTVWLKEGRTEWTGSTFVQNNPNSVIASFCGTPGHIGRNFTISWCDGQWPLDCYGVARSDYPWPVPQHDIYPDHLEFVWSHWLHEEGPKGGRIRNWRYVSDTDAYTFEYTETGLKPMEDTYCGLPYTCGLYPDDFQRLGIQKGRASSCTQDSWCFFICKVHHCQSNTVNLANAINAMDVRLTNEINSVVPRVNDLDRKVAASSEQVAQLAQVVQTDMYNVFRSMHYTHTLTGEYDSRLTYLEYVSEKTEALSTVTARHVNLIADFVGHFHEEGFNNLTLDTILNNDGGCVDTQVLVCRNLTEPNITYISLPDITIWNVNPPLSTFTPGPPVEPEEQDPPGVPTAAVWAALAMSIFAVIGVLALLGVLLWFLMKSVK